MEKALKKYWPIFLLPTIIAFIIGFIIPFVEGLYLSFCQFTTVNNAKFIGISNYIKSLSDPQLIYQSLISVSLSMLIPVVCFIRRRDSNLF